MKLRKRFVAWLLAGVIAVSSIQFPEYHVQAEEIQMDEIAVETNKKESENVEMGSESEEEHEPSVTGEQKDFFTEEYEETVVVDKVVESDEPEKDNEIGSDVDEIQRDVEESSTVILTGNCGDKGDNVTFVLDSDGLLTISGSGEMENYQNDDNVSPWSPLSTNDISMSFIKSIIINEGVTSIGNCAFSYCISLTSVKMPEGPQLFSR